MASTFSRMTKPMGWVGADTRPYGCHVPALVSLAGVRSFAGTRISTGNVQHQRPLDPLGGFG